MLKADQIGVFSCLLQTGSEKEKGKRKKIQEPEIQFALYCLRC